MFVLGFLPVNLISELPEWPCSPQNELPDSLKSNMMDRSPSLDFQRYSSIGCKSRPLEVLKLLRKLRSSFIIKLRLFDLISFNRKKGFYQIMLLDI